LPVDDVIPTSTTTTPRDHGARIRPGGRAPTEISASLGVASEVTRPRWQTSTVAFLADQQERSRHPDHADRPTTTAASLDLDPGPGGISTAAWPSREEPS